MEKKRIVITGGGTGGHVFPGIAVGKELLRHPEVEVLFVGKDGGPEAKWVAEAGLPFSGIRASGFPRTLGFQQVRFWWDLAAGCLQAGRLVGSFRPGAVLATGGYVSAPLSLAAFLRGTPVILFEPNLAPGLAARILGRISKKIFVGFQKTLGRFAEGKTEWSGTPVRREIWEAEKAAARRSFGLDPEKDTLLLVGGSQGSHALNEAVTEALRFLGLGKHSLQALLVTGGADFQRMNDRLEDCGLKVILRPFIPNIHEAYAAADLVVARSGAITCAEIAARGLPAVFVPYPHASGHQEDNARVLEGAGAARVILEGELDGERLAETVLSLMADRGKLGAMGESARRLAKPEAARAIAQCLLEAAEGK